MSRTIRDAPANGAELVTSALDHIRNAQLLLTHADCPRALQALRIARKSAEGAERHMHHRLARRRTIAAPTIGSNPRA